MKFNTSGIRQWGTYYGGSDDDLVFSSVIDGSGNVFIVGSTDSNTGAVIATVGAHQSVYGGGTSDAYLVKFNSAGQRQWGTYYGGNGDDFGNDCTVDITGTVCLVGSTDSNAGAVIATPGAHQFVYGGGTSDSFLVKFNSSGLRQWGTYYGGNGLDVGNCCSIDATGNVYLGGITDSNTGTVIATAGAHQSVYGGNVDGFW